MTKFSTAFSGAKKRIVDNTRSVKDVYKTAFSRAGAKVALSGAARKDIPFAIMSGVGLGVAAAFVPAALPGVGIIAGVNLLAWGVSGAYDALKKVNKPKP